MAVHLVVVHESRQLKWSWTDKKMLIEQYMKIQCLSEMVRAVNGACKRSGSTVLSRGLGPA